MEKELCTWKQKIMKDKDYYHECVDITHGMNYRKVINKSWGYEVIAYKYPSLLYENFYIYFPDQETSLHYHLKKQKHFMFLKVL